MRRLAQGVNQDIIKEMNRSLILRLLLREKTCSRVHLARLSNLKQATLTNIISDLIEWGLVKEVAFLSGKKGRRSIGIAINTDDYRVLCVRLARRHFLVGVADLTGEIRRSVKVDTVPEDSPEDVVEQIKKTLHVTIAMEGKVSVLAMGVAIPGPFIRQKGQIALMTENTKWNNVSIKEKLEMAFQVPVFCEHDANAGVIAQQRFVGDTCGEEGFIYVIAGQGVGAGVIANGDILKGTLGIAGEIGHTTICYDGPQCACGNRGCLERYCSSIAFTNAVNEERVGLSPLNFKEISIMTREGDPVCVEKYRQAAYYLALGIVNLVNSFNPSLIIVGDEMAHVLPDEMLTVLREVVQTRVLPEIYANMQIRISDISSNSALNGAGIVAINEIFANPLLYCSLSKK